MLKAQRETETKHTWLRYNQCVWNRWNNHIKYPLQSTGTTTKQWSRWNIHTWLNFNMDYCKSRKRTGVINWSRWNNHINTNKRPSQIIKTMNKSSTANVSSNSANAIKNSERKFKYSERRKFNTANVTLLKQQKRIWNMLRAQRETETKHTWLWYNQCEFTLKGKRQIVR